MNKPKRFPAKTAVVTAAILASWIGYEGFRPEPYIPTKGDVPTIGHGSTEYEDGRKVKLTDPPITRKRAAELAMNQLDRKYATCVRARLGDALVSETEFKLAVDFAGQYGCTAYAKSSIATNTALGRYENACKAYLLYKYAAGYDCSTLVNGRPNKRCWGVWDRSMKRSQECMDQL